MPDRGRLVSRIRFTVSFLAVAVGAIALLHACHSLSDDDIHPAGPSFFPLSVGNSWVFTASASRTARDSAILETKDTLLIDQKVIFQGRRYYRLRWTSWSGAQTDTWVYRDHIGNVHWADSPGSEGHRFLMFNAAVGDTWHTGREGCLDSLRMWDDYAVVETPYGRFDGAQEIGDIGHCLDFGWGVTTVRGIGPVRWTQVTIAGPIEWLLTDAQVHDDLSPTLSEKPLITNNGR